MRVIKGFKSAVKSVTFSPDGRLLAAACGMGTMTVWDALTGEPRGDFVAFEDGGYSEVTFARDSRHVVVTTLSVTVVWDVVEGQRVKELRSPSMYKTGGFAGFLDDGTLVMSRGDRQAGIYLISPSTWEVTHRWDLTGYGLAGQPEAIEPGGDRAATNTGLVVEVRTGKLLGRWGDAVKPYAGRGGSMLAWCPRKPLLAVSNRGKTIDVIDPDTAVKVTTLTSPSKYYEAFAFTPDGRHLIAVSNDRVARLYDTSTWAARETLDWGIGPLKSIAVAADGSRAAAGSGSTNSGKAVIWDLD